jgi:plastocyanin
MRRTIVMLSAVAALVGGAAPTVDAATKTVAIRHRGFDPKRVTVQTGDTVTWKNVDRVRHQVVANSGAFASGLLAPGKSYSFTFTKTGTFRYHDGLHPARKGTVVVKTRPVPPAVSLTTSVSVVTFGGQTTLSGTVSNAKPNQPVIIYARQYDQPAYVQLATLLTGPSGTFSYSVAPPVQTTYQVRFRSAASPEIGVAVRPKLRFLGSPRYFSVRVLGARPFAGHYVVLQRKTRSGWAGVVRYKLGRHSGRVFLIPHVHGTRVYRMFISARQAAPGYAESWSGTQRATRR